MQRQIVSLVSSFVFCIGCSDSNSPANSSDDGGSGSVASTEPVEGVGGGSEVAGGRNASGGASASLGGATTGSVSSGGVPATGGANGSVSVGSGAGIFIPSGGSPATGGSTGSCLSVTSFCSVHSDCCNNNCVNGHCYDIPVSTGGSTSTGGRSSTGGNTGTAGCAQLGQLCSQFGTPCCASTSYQIVCSGVCQIALIAAGGSS